MTYRGYSDKNTGQQEQHEVEIEETGGDEFEVISAERWESLDQCENSVAPSASRSMKSLLDDDTDDSMMETLDTDSDESSSSFPSKAYKFAKGWSALDQIDSFLDSMEIGTTTLAPNQIEEKAETLVDENSVNSSASKDSATTKSKTDGDHGQNLRGEGEGTKSSAVQDSQVDNKIKQTRKRVCILCFLLTLVVVAIVSLFAFKVIGSDTVEPKESNDENATTAPTFGNTVSFNPPDEYINNSFEPGVLSEPVGYEDDDYTNPLISVDPSNLDPSTANSLLTRLQTIYASKGIDSSPLDASSGDGTPQRKALFWLGQDNHQYSYDQSTQTTRYALAVFYYSTNAVPNFHDTEPDSWQIVDGWLTPASHCSWYGIICNTQGLVESIEMPMNFLTGSLPMELGFLEEALYSIDITDDAIAMFESDYDVFMNLSNLERFFANNNFLESTSGLPWQMGSLVNLELLELSFNILGGDLSSNSVLASMPNLELLELEFNHFTGSIPSYFGNMEKLQYMYLRDNKLTGDLSFLNSGRMKSLCKCVSFGMAEKKKCVVFS